MPHLSGVLAGSYPACIVGLVLLPPRGWWSPLPVIMEEDCILIFTGEIEKKFKGWGSKGNIVEQNQYGLVGLKKRNICNKL